MLLERGNEEFKKTGKPLPLSTVRGGILDKLAVAMFEYEAYPSKQQRTDVAIVPIKKHPCVTELTAYLGWEGYLRNKMSNYRSKLRGYGVPGDAMCNALKKKAPEPCLGFVEQT